MREQTKFNLVLMCFGLVVLLAISLLLVRKMSLASDNDTTFFVDALIVPINESYLNICNSEGKDCVLMRVRDDGLVSVPSQFYGVKK